MSYKRVDVAIVGATGAVGEIMLKILEQRDFPAGEIFPLASIRSVGRTVEYKNKPISIINLEEFDFSRCQLALFSAGSAISEKYVPIALEKGCFVIDNTSLFRRDENVPLIVSEVNPHCLNKDSGRLIANPNCSTMGMLVAIKPLHQHFGIKRINVATYQAVSGAGKKAINCLSQQTMSMMRNERISPDDYPPFTKQIAFNAIPHIGDFAENGYTIEEMKMVWETHKILEDEDIMVNVTCVRVPVFYGHSLVVNLEFNKELDEHKARDILANSPSISVMDKREDGGYPTPLNEGGKDDVFVGRIRKDISHPNALTMWIVADNLRKGAALNSVQLAELAIEKQCL